MDRTITWLGTDQLDPPHRVTHPEHADALTADMARVGWRMGAPACLGYDLNGRVQLISGSHRWEACRRLGRLMPVVVMPYAEVAALWGTDAWVSMVLNPPAVR